MTTPPTPAITGDEGLNRCIDHLCSLGFRVSDICDLPGYWGVTTPGPVTHHAMLDQKALKSLCRACRDFTPLTSVQ